MKSEYNYGKNNKYSVLIALLFYLMGIAGVLLGFADVFGGSVRLFIIPVIIVLCIFIFAFSHSKGAYILHILLLLIAFCLFAYFFRDRLIQYAENVFFAITKDKSLRNYDITYIMLALALLSGESIGLLLILFRKTRLCFVMLTAVIILAAVFARSVSTSSVMLIMLSLCGLHIAKTGAKGSIILCAAFTVLLLAVFMLSASAVGKNNELLCDAADQVESLINDNINRIVYNRGNNYDSGRVNRGNNHQTGQDALELWLSDKPEEDLYLRGFSGGEYTNGQWSEADESEFFTRISTERGWSRWGNLVDTTYKEIYYNANSLSNPDVLRRGKRLTINPVTGSIKNRYYPYIERWERLTRKQNIAYVYSYYELKDLNIIHDNLFGQVLRVYDDMQKNYEPYVYEKYLSVPNGLDRLKALCDSAHVSSVEDAVAFVQNTLAENAEYTLKPGIAPLNDDIVEYFLFENKRGYCVHFASAGTLMFRMLGIPARYVTGYRINKGLFYKQDDEDYYARISDRYAHAWPEIYVRDKGWIPVEVTPSASNIIASQGGEDSREQETSTEGVTSATEATEEDTTYTAVNSGGNKNIPIILLSVIAVLFVIIRRIVITEKIKKSPVRRLFAIELDIIGFHGEKLTGLERDIAQRLAIAIPTVSHKDAERLVKAVYDDAYGGIEADEGERAFALDMYYNIAEYVYKSSNIFKKLFIRLVKVWL